VPVAYEVARALRAPLDVLIASKIGAPGNPEYGVGALAEGGVLVLDDRAVRALQLSHEDLGAAIARARDEIGALVERFRAGRPPLALAGRTAIVVDDGVATGVTARAAVRAVHAQRPRRLVLAVPVGAVESVAALRAEVDEVVCVIEPRSLRAVGAWYQDFTPTSDAEILDLLAATAMDRPPRRRNARAIGISIGAGAEIAADLELPAGARALVLFAHGSGSSRHSARNRQVAAALNDCGMATLLLDLLTVDEEHDRANVFDIPLLAGRLVAATRWAQADGETCGLPIAYFGASTGAGAALWAASELGSGVSAIVSRGGRPDLAAARLAGVRAPVLLIVGGRDPIVLELNRQAASLITAPCELSIVAGATHLFEEPGALEQVCVLAASWFEQHLASATPAVSAADA